MADLKAWLRGVFGGNAAQEPDSSLPYMPARPVGPEGVNVDDNDFAVALYGQLRQRPGNLFFSPLSVRAALAMALAGARGETAAEMSKALCFAASGEDLHSDLGYLLQRLNAALGVEYEMTVASSLWGQAGISLQAAFVDLLARHYRGEMNLVDFRGDAEAACREINRWVEEKTRRKIKDIVSTGSLDPTSRLVLVNAVYFKGLWALPFRKADTRDKPFHLAGGGTVKVPLMGQQKPISYVQARDYQAVDLVYQGGDLSLLVLLPDRRDGLADLEKTLSASLLHDCVAQMESREVELYLPRFRITSDAMDLRDPLTALGMPRAFERSQADFSGIDGHAPPDEEALFIAAVLHKAFVEVNEEGTEAAAATAVLIPLAASMGAPRPPAVPVFRADHPFVFAIRDRRNGAILFLGRMADPTRASERSVLTEHSR
jgi:serpin B